MQPTPTDYVPATSRDKQRIESYVHSSVVFLKDLALCSGSPDAYRMKLRIEPVRPKRFSDAGDGGGAWSFRWWLRAMVHVVRGRNIEKSYQVRIGLPELPSASDVGAKPKMSTPKKSTGPAENGLPWWSQGRRPAVLEDSDE